MKVNKAFDEIVEFLAGHTPERVVNFHPSEETQKRAFTGVHHDDVA